MENVNHKNYYIRKQKQKESKNNKDKTKVVIPEKIITKEKIVSDITVTKNLSYYINKILFLFKRK